MTKRWWVSTLRINLTSTDALGGTSKRTRVHQDQKVANVGDAPVFAPATGTGSVAESTRRSRR